MNKQVLSYQEVKDKILHAVDTITDPIKQTMGPKGGNAVIQKDSGEVFITNDGVTIAKEIYVKDAVEDAVIQLIKQSALKTNTEAGDGTSTTILLSSILVKEGFKMIDNGVNQVDVVNAYNEFAEELKKQIEKQKLEIKDDKDLSFIAKISSNNDEDIAKDVVKIVRKIGEDGIVFFEISNKQETEIIEDDGFMIEPGVLTHELLQTNGVVSALDVPVLITDKQLYYEEEAETIMRTVLQNGYKDVVVVAKDFVGKALPSFVTNHQSGMINIILIKDSNIESTNGESLEDLAVFLGGEVVSDKKGSLVDNIDIEDFIMSPKVFGGIDRVIISRYVEERNKKLEERVKLLQKRKKDITDEDSAAYKQLEQRIASLTKGFVTLKIGGRTGPEIFEKQFRYEDAIRACNAAIKYGYLPGGGMALLTSYQNSKRLVESWQHKYCSANSRQVIENAGLVFDVLYSQMAMSDFELGYNAATGLLENMLEAGVVDPYRVTEMAIDNSVSIANAILGSRYILVNDLDNETGKEK